MANDITPTSAPGPEGGEPLRAGLGAEAYAREIVRRQSARWRRHEGAARAGNDPEDVHALRVSSQRARAALRAYRGVLPDGASELREELGGLRRELETVRDLDVQIARVAAHAERAVTSATALGEIEAALAERRRAALVRMNAALAAPRSRAVLSALARLGTGVPSEDAGQAAIEAVASRLVRRARRRARRALRRLDAERSGPAAHRLRRRCRELRYVVEFHEPLWGVAAQAVRRRLVVLQDRLGAAQDAAVARGWIERLLVEEGPRFSRPAVFEAGRLHEAAAPVAREKDVQRLVRHARRALDGPGWRALARSMKRVARA